MSQPYLPLINSAIGLSEDRLDLNGDIFALLAELLAGGDIDMETLYIKGNGMLESYEFALITYCLEHHVDFSDQAFVWTGQNKQGISSAAVAEAWENNLAQMQYDLGGTEDNIALRVLGGADTLFAGYMTLGDSSMQTVLGFASAYLSTWEDVGVWLPGISFRPIIAAQYVAHPEWFTARADPDFDGFTNAEEYMYFESDGKETYAKAALTPGMRPIGVKDLYEAGESLRLYVPMRLHVNTTYQWYRDGIALSDSEHISGANARTLNIASLTVEDAGLYTCTYNERSHTDPEKDHGVHGPIQVNVVSNLPVAGGLGILAAVMAFMAAVRVRRLRRSAAGD